MLEAISPFYFWFKAGHIVSAMIWIGGQCLLLVLLGMHRTLLADGKDADLLSIVERRCLAIVVNPAMLATLLLGMILFLVQGTELLSVSWFQLKLVAVSAMIVLHSVIASTHSCMRRTNSIPMAGRIPILQGAGLVLAGVIVSLVVIK